MRKEAYDMYKPLNVPKWMDLAVKSGGQESCMKLVGQLLKEVVAECDFPFRFPLVRLLNNT